MADLCTLIESRLETAREKVAAENAAEEEAKNAEKQKMPTATNEPKTSKGVKGDMGFPKASGPIKSSDLRKMSELIEEALEEEKKEAEHIVKVASDLALEAAVLDAEDQHEQIKKAWGPISTKDMEELTKKANIGQRLKSIAGTAAEELGFKNRAPKEQGFWGAATAKMKAVGGDPTESAANREILESNLPETPAIIFNAAKKSIQGQLAGAADEGVNAIGDATRSLFNRPVPASNAGRNLAIAGGLGGAGAAGYLGHRAGVRSEQAKDPAQIRAAYGLGWQRGKTAEEKPFETEKVARLLGGGASVIDRAKNLLGIGGTSNMRQNLMIGGAGVGGAAAGGAAGYTMGHDTGEDVGMEAGIASEQAKDPYQIRSAYGLGARHGARWVLSRMSGMAPQAQTPTQAGQAVQPSQAGMKMASDKSESYPELTKVANTWAKIKGFFTGGGAAKGKVDTVDKLTQGGYDFSHNAPNASRATRTQYDFSHNRRGGGGGQQGFDWRQRGRDAGFGGAVDWLDQNAAGVGRFMDQNPGAVGLATGAIGAPIAGKALQWAGRKAGVINSPHSAGALETLGGKIRGKDLTAANARGNRALGVGAVGAGGFGAYQLGSGGN